MSEETFAIPYFDVAATVLIAIGRSSIRPDWAIIRGILGKNRFVLAARPLTAALCCRW